MKDVQKGRVGKVQMDLISKMKSTEYREDDEDAGAKYERVVESSITNSLDIGDDVLSMPGMFNVERCGMGGNSGRNQ